MIIFHIGPPKTATTFLQYKIFNKAILDNYYHKMKNINVKTLAKLIQHPEAVSAIDEESCTKWLTELTASDFSLVSNENISSQASFWLGTGPSPSDVAHRIVSLAKRAGFAVCDIKLIFGTRRQDQMLASRYSQGAASKPHYSQSGFEKCIDTILHQDKTEPAHEWLYFDKVLVGLREVFDKKAIFVYSVKDLADRPLHVIEALSNFCHVNFLPALELAINEKKLTSVNKKSVGSDCWQLGGDGDHLLLLPETKQRIVSHFLESNERFKKLSRLDI